VSPAADALFIADGNRFLPTELTRTGWVADAQHGGPPCALLAHLIEGLPADAPMHVVRATFDLMRAVPMTPLRATCGLVRAGKRVQLATASLFDGDLEVARASALRIRVGDVELPPSPFTAPDPLPAPEDTPPADGLDWAADDDLTRFHLHAIEIRTVDRSFWTPGRGRSWIRLRYPVVAGEPLTPLTRVAALADVANGNAMALDPDRYLFVNPDVTLYLHRPHEGEWLGMDSVAFQHATGIGLTDTLLYETRGPIGRVNQAQLPEERRRTSSPDASR
jgi:hypothetical protein